MSRLHTTTFSSWQLALVGLLAVGCGDDSGKTGGTTTGRAPVLNLSAGQVAQAALADMPSADFVSAKQRVQKYVPDPKVKYARAYTLGTGRTPITTDPTFVQVRVDAATALGTTIDDVKAKDQSNADPALDALLAEIVKITPGAINCDALPAPKNDACAYALIIIDVLRSQAAIATGSDAGVPTSDGAVTQSPDGGGSITGPVTLFNCPTVRDTTGATIAKDVDTTTGSTTWSGKVLVKNTIYVSDVTLTIAPGTTIFMDADARLEIGWNSSGATLIADATAAAPILFCGVNGGKGFWDAVVTGTKLTTNSVARNVLFSDGSSTEEALKILGTLSVDNVQVRNALKDGVWAEDFKSDSKQLSIEGVGGTAVSLTGEDATTHFPLGGTLTNNTANEALISFDTFANTTVLHNIGIPYVQSGTVYQQSGDLTFEAGVDYRFKPDSSLELGWNSASAGVHISGTAASHVKFGTWQSVTARWATLSIDRNVTTNSAVTYADFSGGGSTQGPVLQIAAPILLDHVTATDNLVGVSLTAPLAAGSNNLTITKTKGYPLTVTPDAVFAIPQGGTFTGNDTDQIKIDGDTFDKGTGTIADLGVPYFVNESIYQDDGSSITVAPGTDFVMNTDVLFQIGWNGGKTSFIAKGTAAAPITFTGATAMAGAWKGLQLGYAVLSTTAFDYVQIGHAGGGAIAALEIKAPNPSTNPPVSVTNSKFFMSAGWGILKGTDVTADYVTTNTFETCALGNVGSE